MGGGGSSSSRSQVQFYPGQLESLESVFAKGGIVDQLLAGKPSVAAERAQATGLAQLQRQQASQGVGGQPIAARQASDYAVQSGRVREQDFLQNLQAFMQPAGQQSKSSSVNASILGSG